MKFSTLTRMADHMQIYKYVIHQVANAYGKTATFMPKPVFGDNGSGMHVQPVDLEGRQAGVRRQPVCRPLGDLPVLHRGILKHAKAINAFSNRPPTPTSAWCRATRAGAARLLGAQPVGLLPHPVHDEPEGQARRDPLPGPGREPYLCFVALLMAGLDGIKNKIHPGPAMDKNLYDLPPEELKEIPTVCGSLREALASLDADRDFLKAAA